MLAMQNKQPERGMEEEVRSEVAMYDVDTRRQRQQRKR
jgi:hypothetical protein